MRINQHFRCIRDIINSCLLFFSQREIILRPKTPSVVSVMSAESFPGAVEVTCFFLSSLRCFSPPPSTDALHRLQRWRGKKASGFARIATWRGEAGSKSVFAGKTRRSGSAGSTGLPAAFWGKSHTCWRRNANAAPR